MITKKLLCGLVAAAALHCAPAFAEPYSWTGCYIGGNVGGGWHRNSGDQGSSQFTYSATADGFAGGVQGGCDYQFAGSFVVGVQALWDWSRLHGEGIALQYSPDVFKSKTNGFGSLTARIGYLVNPATLVYFKGGVGEVDTHFDYVSRGGGLFLSGTTLTGGRDVNASVLGGGAEWMFAPQWSVVLDYEHYSMGTKEYRISDGGSLALGETIKQHLDKVTIGLNYRFGWQ